MTNLIHAHMNKTDIPTVLESSVVLIESSLLPYYSQAIPFLYSVFTTGCILRAKELFDEPIVLRGGGKVMGICSF